MKRFAVVQRCLHGPVAPTGIPGEVLLGARKESLPQGPGQEAKPLSAPGLAQFTNRQRTTWEKHPRLRPKSFSLPQCLCVLLLKAAARGVGGGGVLWGRLPVIPQPACCRSRRGRRGCPRPPLNPAHTASSFGIPETLRGEGAVPLAQWMQPDLLRLLS